MAQKKIRLNDRHSAILRLCFQRGWLTLYDVTPLFIPNYKYARTVLNQLVQKKVLFKVNCPLSSSTRGLGLAFYAIDIEGHRLIHGTARGFKRKYTPTSVHLLHHYIANIFLTGLQVFARQNSADLYVDTLTEKEIKEKEAFYHFFLSKFDKTSAVAFAIPDFAFLLRKGNQQTLFLGEVDTSTENISSQKLYAKTIMHKFESFNYYYENGIYEFFENKLNTKLNGFKYLHITTGNIERVKSITQVCDELDLTMPVLVTTAPKIYPKVKFDKNRTAKVNYSPLIEAKWFNIQSKNLTTLMEQV